MLPKEGDKSDTPRIFAVSLPTPESKQKSRTILKIVGLLVVFVCSFAVQRAQYGGMERKRSMQMKKRTQRITSMLLAMVLLLGLTPTTVLAAELKAETEKMSITVTMDTQAVAEDATLYGLELLPISTEVTVPTDSTTSRCNAAMGC